MDIDSEGDCHTLGSCPHNVSDGNSVRVTNDVGIPTYPPRLSSDGVVQCIVPRRRDDKHRIVRTQVQMLHVLKRVLLQS